MLLKQGETVAYLNQFSSDTDGSFSFQIPADFTYNDSLTLQLGGASSVEAYVETFVVGEELSLQNVSVGASYSNQELTVSGKVSSASVQTLTLKVSKAGVSLSDVTFDSDASGAFAYKGKLSMSGVDLVLIVAEPSLSGRSDLERILKTGEIFQTKTAVCVNKYDVSPENTEEIEGFCAKHSVPFTGRIPYDKQASNAINAGKSVADIDCPASRALRKVFERTMYFRISSTILPLDSTVLRCLWGVMERNLPAPATIVHFAQTIFTHPKSEIAAALNAIMSLGERQ